jgi:large subunit ribosomal protein L5
MNLKERYQKEVIGAMMKEFGYKSPMAVPKIEKVVVNIGLGRMVADKSGKEREKIYNEVLNDLALICGQRPVLCRARKSISSFKIRKGMLIGAKVTLRRKKMYDFLERLIHIVLPRSRDFRGLNPDSLTRTAI